MEDEAFAHQLASWIDPLVLADAALRYTVERERALAPATLVIGSGRLRSGDEGGYAELAAKFLRGFKMPRALVDLVRVLRPDARISDESWRWLEEFRFSGEVCVCTHGDVPEGCPPQTILLVRERDAVVDLVRAPLFGLLDIVVHCAVSWQELASLGAAIYHEPNMPSAFYAYVDSCVGTSYLDLIAPPHLSGGTGPKMGYRAVTVYGRPPDEMWEIARKLAAEAAKSTLTPRGVPDHHDAS